jgi:PAS domain S-box-containing protein
MQPEFFRKNLFLPVFVLSGRPLHAIPLKDVAAQPELQHREKEPWAKELIIADKKFILEGRQKDKRAKRLSEAKDRADSGRGDFEAIFNNTNDLIWSVDSNLNLLSFNNAFSKAIELSSGKALAKGDPVLSSQFTEGQLSRYKAFYQSALSGESFTISDHFDYPVGFWVEISFHPIRKNNKIVGAACFSRDITERKIADLERDKMTRDMLQAIKELNHTVEARGLPNLTWQSVSFTELVAGISGSINHILQKEDIEIRCDFTATDELFTLRTYLHSIFYNLISNSVKYRRPLQHTLIEIKSHRSENKTVLDFTDNGLGIDLQKKGGQVFGLYKRFHDHIEGKGMGLFMVKTQVESLGGSIAIQSEVHKGTRFTIEFDG